VTIGHVTLVGAGPSDPDLLTLRAVRALERCDLVLYDALIDPEVLEHAGRAQRFYVGKRSGRHSVSQETICRLLVRAGRAGRRVVRLKCGDPFVFGRGGEEAIALAEAGIPVEIVPGISSALAAPLAFGIPLTHRGVSSSFVVMPGEPSDVWRQALAAGPRPRTTLVLLMARGKRSEIAAHALASGHSRDLPVALILGACSPRAWAWTGRLADLAAVSIPDDKSDLPGLIVMGDVVALSHRIAASTSRRETPREFTA
jgi:uroporphyrin-III C-methyltransferase/precorrin-2 dehydrogenase/sirohydrochlorin ferrochelatase